MQTGLSELTSLDRLSVIVVMGSVRLDHFVVSIFSSDGKRNGENSVAVRHDAYDALDSLFCFVSGCPRVLDESLEKYRLRFLNCFVKIILDHFDKGWVVHCGNILKEKIRLENY